jgi:DNA polymerase-3 subunit delta'
MRLERADMPFRDVIGHRRLVELLTRSIGRQALPPSLIFSGPAGIGKRHLAIAAAQALNCLTPVELDACGHCAACTRIARGIHPDVLIVEPGETGSIKIDQVREIVERAGYRPFEGRRRVVIVDDADALVAAAQNALLKTLEEPPGSSIFVLITSRPDMLLPTVRSRCPELRFRALTADEVAAVLVARGRTDTEAHAVAALAGGSVTHALEAAAGDLVEARQLAVRILTQAANTPEPRRRIDYGKELLTKTGAGAANDREQVTAHLRAMGSLIRDIEVIATGARETTLANPDVRPALERLTAYRGARGVRAYEAIGEALDALNGNAGAKTVADWLVLQL